MAAFGLGAAICGLGYLCGGTEPGGVATALSAAALLNAAILVHEGGHLAAARAMGVAVREFAVGVGPRVAWWQGATTTYSVRALPLFGYVSFLTAAQLARGGPGGGAAPSGPSGRPLLLLEHLTPGRRAVVIAAGVAANALLAAALVAAQVFSYGDVTTVVRPGALVREAEGWQPLEPAVQPQPEAPSRLRLRRGDVVLSVGGRELAAGEDMSVAIVQALQAAVADAKAAADRLAAARVFGAAMEGEQEAAAATAAWPGEHAGAAPQPHQHSAAGASSCSGGGGFEADLGAGLALPRSIRMAVLRYVDGGADSGGGGQSGGACPPGSSGSGSSCVRRREVVEMDALDLLGYEMLAVAPNLAVVSRRPADFWEGVATVGKELRRWTSTVLTCWTEALGAATQGPTASEPHTSAAPTTAATAATSAARNTCAGSDHSRVGSPSSSSGSGHCSSASSSAGNGAGPGSSASSSHVVGPLGLVASIAEAAASQARARAQTPTGTRSPSAGLPGSPSDCGGGLLDDDDDHESLRVPPLLLDMGIQLNLQLAFINLLPVPVLDGGQLLLVALEAARGGRRLPAGLERAALLGSGVVVGCYVVALSVQDVVGLMDRAATRLEVAMAARAGPNHLNRQEREQRQQQQAAIATAAVAVAPGGDLAWAA